MQGSIPILSSWLYWQNHRHSMKNIYGYVWPNSLEEFERATDMVCPFCSGAKTFEMSDTGEEYMCVCGLLSWIEGHDYRYGKYETPVQPANLEDLKPFSYLKNKRVLTTGVEELKNLKKYLKHWIKKPIYWMAIEGGTGSGKTHILRAIKHIYPAIAVFVSMERFQARVFDGLDKRDLNDMIRALSTAPILLLDDWGLEHQTQMVTDTLAAIINQRYLYGSKNYVTVVTTNLSFAEMSISPNIAIRRIASRLSDTQIGDIFLLQQPDFRLPDIQTNLRWLE